MDNLDDDDDDQDGSSPMQVTALNTNAHKSIAGL